MQISELLTEAPNLYQRNQIQQGAKFLRDEIEKVGQAESNSNVIQTYISRLSCIGMHPQYVIEALENEKETILTYLRSLFNIKVPYLFVSRLIKNALALKSILPKLWPEVIEILNEGKSRLIKNILIKVKELTPFPGLETIERLHALGIHWPELDIIQKSIHAERPDLIEAKAVKPTLDDLVELVYANPSAIKRMKEPREEIQLAAIDKDWSIIQYIKNQTPYAQEFAMEKSEGEAFKLLINPDERIVYRAVRNDPFNIRYVADPDEDIQLMAVRERLEAVDSIKNPCPAVQMMVIRAQPEYIGEIPNPTPEMQMEAIKRDGMVLKYIKNPTPAIQVAAIKSEGEAIQFIQNPSREMQITALSSDGNAIRYIPNPDTELQTMAVKKTPRSIRYIKDPSLELQRFAFKQDSRSILYVNNPLPELLEIIARSNPLAIGSVKGRIPNNIRRMVADKLNQIKEPTIKDLLQKLKDVASDEGGYWRHIEQDIKTMKRFVKWPELDVIERSLNADFAPKRGRR